MRPPAPATVLPPPDTDAGSLLLLDLPPHEAAIIETTETRSRVVPFIARPPNEDRAGNFESKLL
jgi:hypothetical protein